MRTIKENRLFNTAAMNSEVMFQVFSIIEQFILNEYRSIIAFSSKNRKSDSDFLVYKTILIVLDIVWQVWGTLEEMARQVHVRPSYHSYIMYHGLPEKPGNSRYVFLSKMVRNVSVFQTIAAGTLLVVTIFRLFFSPSKFKSFDEKVHSLKFSPMHV